MISMYVQHLHQGLSVGRSICNKGGPDPITPVFEDTINSINDAVKNTGSSFKDALQNDSTGLLGPALTIAGGYFGPWGAAAAQAAQARAKGNDWVDTAGQAALAYGGSKLASALGAPQTAEDGFNQTYSDGNVPTDFGGGESTTTVSGTNGVFDPYQTDAVQISNGPRNPVSFETQGDGSMTGQVNQPEMSTPQLGGLFSEATSQAPAPVTDMSTINNGQVTGPSGAPVNTGSNMGDYTFDAIKGNSGMDWGTLGKARTLGNLWGAYQSQQRQGQLQDMFNQQRGAYDAQLANYNNYSNQMNQLAADPTSYFNSAEYQGVNSRLAAELARRDAASGRRSQYGARSMQLNQQFMNNLQNKMNTLNTARGSAPSANGMSNAYNAMAANENAFGQNIAGAATNYFAPQLGSLMSIFGG